MDILVVDDNRSSAEAMGRILRKQGHEVVTLFDGAAAIEHLDRVSPQLVFTDLKMEPIDGMEVLRAARSKSPPVEVVVFTAFGAVDHAVEAMRLGARDFLTKPISVEQILERVRGLDGSAPILPTFASGSPLDQALLQLIDSLADVPSPVWVEGEVGSGRLTAARRLHEASQHDDLHVLDASTFTTWPDRGTVVLVDVDQLDDTTQQTLARRLKTLPSSLRLISTARPGGRERIAAGTLHADLYFSLAVFTVTVKPMRDRLEDVSSLFRDAVAAYCTTYNRPIPTLPSTTDDELRRHGWPGNLKELLNLAERTAVLGAPGFQLVPSTAKPSGSSAPTAAPLFTDGFKLAGHLENIEEQCLRAALDTAKGDRAEAGRLLGVERNTLRYKLKKYNLL